MKTCNRCGVPKDEKEFSSNRPDCKLCVSKRMEAYRKKFPERVREQSQRCRDNKSKETNGLYEIWRSMMRRCYEKTHHAYRLYGARNIRVCKQWHKFDSFFAWAKPLKTSRLYLDRINNEKGYCPENCRFITSRISARNTRRSKVSEETVSKIKQLILEGLSCAKIGQAFDLGIKFVSMIKRNHRWADVPPVLPDMPVTRGRRKQQVPSLI